jgi:hypothetical protein
MASTQLPDVFSAGAGDGFRFNFSWYDYAAGAAYQRFYCAGSYDSVGAKYFLTTKEVDGDYNNRTQTGDCDLDFDLSFNSPVTIGAAEAVFNYTINLGNNGNTSSVTINIYHVSVAAAETLIATGTSKTFTASGASYIRQCLKFPLTQKVIGVGEKLRINVIWDLTGSGAIYYDPGNRQTFAEGGTGATIGSDFVCDIPFRVDPS